VSKSITNIIKILEVTIMTKKKATSKKTITVKNNGEVTLEKAVPEFLEHLNELGKNVRTVEVYGRCLENVTGYFKPDKQLGKITPALSGQFLKSDILLKKPNGSERSEITIRQIIRVYRMMLTWAAEQGYITDIPLPKSEMKGESVAKTKKGNNAEADETLEATEDGEKV